MKDPDATHRVTSSSSLLEFTHLQLRVSIPCQVTDVIVDPPQVTGVVCWHGGRGDSCCCGSLLPLAPLLLPLLLFCCCCCSCC